MTGQVVKFNISGQRYDVSRSLLQIYPNSMLAMSASDQWQEEHENVIFIEGDGSLFRFVLSYLRHGSVSLPATESKEALLKELEYYSIDVEEDAIDEYALHKTKMFQSLRIAIVDLKKYIATKKTEAKRAELSHMHI